MRLTRREALRFGAAGAFAGGITGMLARAEDTLQQGGGGGGGSLDKKFLLIYGRGGNDAVNAVIPDGDPEYHSGIRPDIAIPTVASLALNGFARLHPALASLKTVYDQGNAAFLHRVHTTNYSRSHFTAQQYQETMKIGDLSFEEGFCPRLLERVPSLGSGDFDGASCSVQLQQAFRSQGKILAHIPDIGTYSLSAVKGASTPQEDKLRDLPNPAPGTGLTPGYLDPGLAEYYANVMKANGTVMLASEAAVEPLANAASYVPENGAVYPIGSGSFFSFGDRLKDAVNILKNTDARITGVELGSFDTHVDQGGVTGDQADILAAVADGMQAALLDTTSASTTVNLIVMFISEFARTSAQNGNKGTDHGAAGAFFCIGNDVRGKAKVLPTDTGVFNCATADGTWVNNATLFSNQNRDIVHLTDFRAVFAELLVKHFGITSPTVDPTDMDYIIPGYSTDPEFGTSTFQFLNYLV